MSLYAKLAFVGVQKNRQLYIPFFFTSVGMVAVYYIIAALADILAYRNMYGGRTAMTLLQFGSWIMAVFSLIFLYYTHSFLTRRRQREFGLYNILGMEKRHIAVIMIIETFLTYAISLVIGLAIGALLAKLAETLMLGIMELKVGYEIMVSWSAMVMAAIIFGLIFMLILAVTLLRVSVSNPIALLHSENKGEKPPKSNPLFGIAGVVLLAGAYCIAVMVENPLEAVLFFFIAVLMVIVATYALFVSGSVLLCRILKKRRGYYYRENHFISVSSMAFRMKRSGAGLASICILLTMVLVTITSTLSLYTNVEEMIETAHPRDINIAFYMRNDAILNDEYNDYIIGAFLDVAKDENCDPRNILNYRYIWINTLRNGDTFEETHFYDALTITYEFTFVQLADYNKCYGTDYKLAPGEALVYDIFDGDKVFDSAGGYINVDTAGKYKIVGEVDEFSANGFSGATPAVAIIIDDISPVIDSVDGRSPTMFLGFDVAKGKEQVLNLSQFRYSEIIDWNEEDDNGNRMIRGINWSSKSEDAADSMSMYGGLYFLGIMLSGVFTLAAVLIIYYKQITEGYEDRARFDIMQKVGLTKKQIKQSVNSQMRMVFIMPIAAAALHLAFAMPILRKMLMAIEFRNDALLFTVAVSSVAVCTAIYLTVYKLTATAYYKIVKD